MRWFKKTEDMILYNVGTNYEREGFEVIRGKATDIDKRS